MSAELPQSAHKHSHKSRSRPHRDATRLTRKAGTFYYRRRLPDGLRGELVVSLSTDRFRRAEWLASCLETKFQSLPWVKMTRDEIQSLLRGLLDQLLEDDQAARLDFKERGRPVHASRFDLEDHDGDIRAADQASLHRDIEFWRDVQDEGDFSAVDETVDELLEGREVDSATRRRLAAGVIETFIKAKEVSLGRTAGAGFTVLDMPAGPLVPAQPILVASPSPAPVAPAKPLASALVEPFFTARAHGGASAHDISQDRTTLRLFLEVCEDRPVNSYSRGDVTGFLNTLRKMPKTYGKSPKDKGRKVPDIIAAAETEGAPRLSDKTVKRHLTALSQFFRFAMDEGHLLNAERGELLDGHRFKEERKARNQRDGWTSEELTKLFGSPCWKGSLSAFYRSQPGTHIERDAKFWLPILALYHGARLEELADLYRRDVWCDEGTWAIKIVESEDNAETGDRTLKTENANRILPLHPELIRLGFLAYVDQKAPKPDDPLFPDLKPQGPDKKRGPRITRWFVKYRRSIGLYREGVGMHAFRHTAITRLTDAITDFQQDRQRDFMMGHGGQGGGEGRVRYDKGPGLKACAATLALLRYPEIDLSHLYVEEAG